jgi:hypothetical protein
LSKEFEEHGYPSSYMLANVSENFMNLITVIVFLIVVLALDKLAKAFKK